VAYCKSCGSYIPDADDVCPACGLKTKEAKAEGGKRAAEPKHSGGSFSGAFAQAGEDRREGPSARRADMSGEYKSPGQERYTYDAKKGAERYRAAYDSDARENADLGVLCYLGPLLLIPLLMKPNSTFLRYHCNQGLLLTLFCILSNICFSIPVIGWIAGITGWVIGVKSFFKGIDNVKKGIRSPLPIFSDIDITIIK
jgi:uncharacterized membrane protein